MTTETMEQMSEITEIIKKEIGVDIEGTEPEIYVTAILKTLILLKSNVTECNGCKGKECK